MTALCGANKRQGGGPCRKPAGWGTSHRGSGRCALHGGSTPSHRFAAERDEVRRACDALGLSRQVDPHTALLDELHRTAGHVAWLGEVVADLNREQLVSGVARVTRFSDGTRTIETRAAPSTWLRLYQHERAHLIKVAKIAVDAGCSERVIAVAEGQAAMFVEVIASILSDVGVDLAGADVRAVVRDRLAQVAGSRVLRAGAGRDEQG